MKTTCLMLALASFWLSAADTPSESESSRTPAPVNEEILRFLSGRVFLVFPDMSPSLILKWQMRVADVPLVVVCSDKAAAKSVALKFEGETLAEAVRTVSQKTGTEFRFVKDTVRIATKEEWKEIDGGITTFEKLQKEPEEKDQ